MKRRAFIASTVITALGVSSLNVAFAQGSGSMAQIRESGKLRIGVAGAEPWFFKDPISEKWTGVGISMGERLAADLGVELVLVETTWQNAIAALQANQIDIMFVLDPTEERKRAIDFPDAPLFYYAMGALVGPDVTAATWEDLDTPDMRIGVTLGTSLDKNMTAMMKSASISRFSTNDEAVAAFAAGRVDAVVQFHPALVVQYARLKMGKVLLPTPVTAVATSAGIRKEDDTEFKDWLNTTFLSLYADGVPREIFTNYLGTKNISPDGIPGLMKEDW
ncbi:transporter substrate-binding domain-containing protein [Falsirhodobacter sp. alg1]|uniref:transporter substrate-binding domain-containing protein n=1 Tax=Falsirhodobacter sp. alg1 TaxID=1472418 RepID=UPI0006940E46|nr:transporter substrate-binding domain-containing protein [Falsirhodobacter sp. alg1]